jgi:hypothetical protein
VKKIGNITLLPKQSSTVAPEEEPEPEPEPEPESEPEDVSIEKPFELEMAQRKLNNIVDKNTTFILCNDKTNAKPPGKEPSETIPPARVKEFEPLAKVMNWRQIL